MLSTCTRLLLPLALVAAAAASLEGYCGHGTYNGGKCTCDPGWQPSGNAVIKHEGKECTNGNFFHGPRDERACTDACARDQSCKYATFTTQKLCSLSSSCNVGNDRFSTVYEMTRCVEESYDDDYFTPDADDKTYGDICNHGRVDGNVCRCDRGWSPNGPAIKKQPGRKCPSASMDWQVFIKSKKECREECANNAKCNFAILNDRSSPCYFASSCTRTYTDDDYTVYEMNRCAEYSGVVYDDDYRGLRGNATDS